MSILQLCSKDPKQSIPQNSINYVPQQEVKILKQPQSTKLKIKEAQTTTIVGSSTLKSTKFVLKTMAKAETT